MFQQSMVPLDGSELAERALPSAERLAQAGGASLHLVRVVEAPEGSMWAFGPVFAPARLYDAVLERDMEAATAYLDGLAMTLSMTGVSIQTIHPRGTPAAALLDYERAARIDLVVMCSHGRGGLARFALGSVAERLLRHGTAPVLLARSFAAPVLPGHALVPLDGSARAEEALRAVRALVPSVVREVTLLRVVHTRGEGPEAERYLHEAAHQLDGEGLTCERQVVQGNPAEVIINVAGADKLVVIATHGRSALTRWALGSVADRVVRHSAAEVLLLRAGITAADGASDH